MRFRIDVDSPSHIMTASTCDSKMKFALLLTTAITVDAYFRPVVPQRSLPLVRSPRLSHGGVGGGNGNDDVWGGWNGGMDWHGGDGEEGGPHFSALGLAPFFEALASGPNTLWGKYNLQLAKNPIPTKAFTSLVGFTLGDVLAQNFLGDKGAPFDWSRLARLASFGAVVHGPSGHYFYGLLDKNFPKKDPLTVALKVLIDQVFWAPIFTVVFFTWIELFSGNNLRRVREKIDQDLIRGVTASWKVWPLVHIINFRFIPPAQRLLYINTIQIGYNVYLSLLANRTTKPDV